MLAQFPRTLAQRCGSSLRMRTQRHGASMSGEDDPGLATALARAPSLQLRTAIERACRARRRSTRSFAGDRSRTSRRLPGTIRPDDPKISPASWSETSSTAVADPYRSSALPDRIRVREALDLFACVRPGGSDSGPSLIRWGLDRQAGSSFAALSGGERQRLLVPSPL